MKVLITGGAGFIGSNLVGYFNREAPDDEITVMDDISTGSYENLAGLDVKLIEADITQDGAAVEAISGMDAVVHLAALGSVPRSIKNPVKSHEVNVNGTLKVLEAARKSGAYVVFASSSSVYGANTKLPKNEHDWTRPLSPYAVTKLAAEAYVLAYQSAYELSTLAFRFYNVFGPKQPANHAYAAVVPAFLDAALQGKALPIHGDGQQSRDFTYVDTVCQALFDAVKRRVVSNDPINLAFGSNTTVMELVETIRRVSKLDILVEHSDPRVGDIRDSQADGLRMRELFPNMDLVPLEVGIERTLKWFQNNGGY